MKGIDSDGEEVEDSMRVGSGLGQWVKGQLSRNPSVASMNCRRSDLRLLLGVMGAPLALVHVSPTDPLLLLSIKGTPIVNPLSLPNSLAYSTASFPQKNENQNNFCISFFWKKVKVLLEFKLPVIV
ncbi:hypothetical protein V6N11_028647 [Hibiscus sabdariffa]|uniref:Uncharacterized protein n=1 Tax=Hibiscus sabdariffa TaxID=183260 RepID=A0ABR2PQF3_9ROSI